MVCYQVGAFYPKRVCGAAAYVRWQYLNGDESIETSVLGFVLANRLFSIGGHKRCDPAGRERGAGQRGGVQFTIIVTATGLMLVTVLTRKRWPSLEAMYC